MSAFTEAIEKAEKKEFTQDEVIDWLESVYNFCIPENKEAGEHAFNVLDYLYMEDLGAHINRQYSEIDTLRAQLAEAREIIKPFTHESLSEQLSGNTIGNDSIVFGRDKAELTLGDFRAARAWYTKVITA